MHPLLQQKTHILERNAVCELIDRLARNLVNIEDKTGEFLLRLDDGRVIDTKGWNGWEWTHGVALYALFEHHDLTSSRTSLAIIHDWFAARRKEGGTTRNINTMAALLSLACV